MNSNGGSLGKKTTWKENSNSNQMTDPNHLIPQPAWVLNETPCYPDPALKGRALAKPGRCLMAITFVFNMPNSLSQLMAIAEIDGETHRVLGVAP
jgi:hypothetical protein